MAKLDWKQEAACRGLDTSTFFSADDAAVAAAKAVCAGCPVRAACLEFAIGTRQGDGVWGGLDADERRRLRRRRQAASRSGRAA